MIRSANRSESSFDDGDSQTSHPPSLRPKSCARCSKDQASLRDPLKSCSPCPKVRYCPHDYRRRHWIVHRVDCKNPSMPKLNPVAAAFEILPGGIHINRVSENDCYTQLIDSYRSLVEDDYRVGGYAHGLYAQENPILEFRQHFRLAEKRGNILPKWWTMDTKKTRVRKGSDHCKSGLADLEYVIGESDIREHHEDIPRQRTDFG